MARKGFSRRSVRRTKDYIWATTVVDQLVLDDEALSISTLLNPADWEASTTGFDRGTLVAIRGWLHTSQIAAGSAADQTLVASYIIKNAATASSAFTPLNAASYDSADVLWCGGALIQGSTLAGDKGRYQLTDGQIHVKSKRKIDSSENIQLVSAMEISAAAAPTYAITGILRVLVQRL